MKSRIFIRNVAIIFSGIVSIVYLAQVTPAKKHSFAATPEVRGGSKTAVAKANAGQTPAADSSASKREPRGGFSEAKEKPNYTTPEDDSSTDASTTKSWTITEHQAYDTKFLNALEWTDYPVGDYVLRTGLIYGKWVAATQFVFNGSIVLTEITPPYEYVTVVDPRTGAPSRQICAVDANNDGVLEIAFLHEKLNDKKYHMYTVYALEKERPKLLWKAGGRLGDWLQSGDTSQRAERVRLHLETGK